MLGRFVAGMIAVLVMVLLPVKYKGLKEAVRMENMIGSYVEETFLEIRQSGVINGVMIEALQHRILNTGIPFKIIIMVGTIITGREERVISISYTDDIFKTVFDEGGEISMRGKLVSIIAVPLRKGTAEKIANMFWNSFIPSTQICSGGYVYG